MTVCRRHAVEEGHEAGGIDEWMIEECIGVVGSTRKDRVEDRVWGEKQREVN